jgi:cell division protein FtsB
MNPTSRWKAIAVLVVVFLLGLVAGIGGTALVVRRTLQKQIATGMVGTPLIDRLEKEMKTTLHLTPAEQTAVGAELDITRHQLIERRQHMIEGLRTTSEDTLSRIKAHLPPDKQAMLEERARNRLAPWGLLNKK